MFSGVFAKRRESYGEQDCLCREVNPYVIRPWNARRGMISEMSGVREEISGGYCGGVPPLPIPNREVKPTSADGTAMQCGRVGNRLLFLRGAMQLVLRGSSFRIGRNRGFGLRKMSESPLGRKWEVGKAHLINQGAKRTAWVSSLLG